MKLCMLLRGEALTVWLELTPAEQKDFKVAKRKIICRMGPLRFVSLDNFKDDGSDQVSRSRCLSMTLNSCWNRRCQTHK